jgi:polysaccharide biosynthesis PFTS motif protein
MSDAGTETWYFIHSIDNFDHYTPQSEGKLYREVLYSFLYFDHIVVWGDNSEQFYRSCPNYFRHFDKLGCLWSEHISQVIRYPEKNDVLRSIQQHFSEKNGKVPEKIIGVFDTTAGGAQMPLQMQDIESFIDGILHILSKYPDVGVVFKIKNPFEYNERYFPEIIEIYKRLIGHPRCYPINATRSRAQSDPSEVTAISDLVISACFTSITVEALGARKRAMYYDATGKFRNLYFDRFPRFVAHDLDQLDDLVQYWLYQCPEEEFSDFLDKHIKGELESYIDGKAITRFRERICR